MDSIYPLGGKKLVSWLAEIEGCHSSKHVLVVQYVLFLLQFCIEEVGGVDQPYPWEVYAHPSAMRRGMKMMMKEMKWSHLDVFPLEFQLSPHQNCKHRIFHSPSSCKLALQKRPITHFNFQVFNSIATNAKDDPLRLVAQMKCNVIIFFVWKLNVQFDCVTLHYGLQLLWSFMVINALILVCMILTLESQERNDILTKAH